MGVGCFALLFMVRVCPVKDLLIEIALTVAIPALLAVLWKMDNRLQALEYDLKLLRRDSNNHYRKTVLAVAQIADHLEKRTGFVCRSRGMGDGDCWPSDDPPTGGFPLT